MTLRKKHRKLKRERLGRKMDKKIEVKEIEDVIEIIKNTLQGLKEDEEVYISVEVIKHGNFTYVIFSRNKKYNKKVSFKNDFE